jgi:general secretion pathway protein G
VRREGQYNRTDTAKAQVAALLNAMNAYHADVGSFPTEKQGLQALRTDPGVQRWRGPYVQKDTPLDPWGHPYRYSVTDSQPQVLSGGMDGHSPIPHPSRP